VPAPRRRRAPAPTSLQLTAFSDRELLFIMDDTTDGDGWTDVEQVAKALNLDHDHPTMCVSSRFSWLKRYGVLERDGRRWKMTNIGRALMNGQLDDTEESVLNAMRQDQLLALTTAITKRYQNANETAATMMRRAWVNGTYQPK
jgi:phage antirepressor YoqD-like protein